MLRRLSILRLVRAKSTVGVTFIDKTKESVPVQAEIGSSLLEVAHRHGIPIEGACEGVCACSTCHVYIHPDFFDRFPAPSEDEEDVSCLLPWLVSPRTTRCSTKPLR